MVKGQAVPFEVWSQYVPRGVDPTTGKPVTAAPKPDLPNTSEEKHVADALLIAEQAKGTPLTPPERKKVRLDAVEEYASRRGRADDRPRVTVQTGMGATDAEEIADAIIRGDQPPTLQGLYRFGAPVRAMLAKKGFDLARAETDWKATQRHITTLNGPQQLRMQQAIDNAYHSLDVIEDLAKQWAGGRFPVLNKGRLAAAKQGALGPQAQQIATQLDAQIADVTSELGNVYMGGNTPTDHSLSLAAKNLQSNWSFQQLVSAINLSRKNLQIRSNSMKNVGVSGASPANPYATPTAPAPSGAVEEWVRDKDGKLVKKVR